MTWEKLQPLDYASQGCLCCPVKPTTLPISTPLVVGFGMVSVTRDGETVWMGDDEHVWHRSECRVTRMRERMWKRVALDAMAEVRRYRGGVPKDTRVQ